LLSKDEARRIAVNIAKLPESPKAKDLVAPWGLAAAAARIKTIETKTTHTRGPVTLTVEQHVASTMTNHDCSLDGRPTNIRGNERIRRCILLLVHVGTTISIIAIVLAVLIVIRATGREARVAWAAAGA
jgi:hypothetical protein